MSPDVTGRREERSDGENFTKPKPKNAHRAKKLYKIERSI